MEAKEEEQLIIEKKSNTLPLGYKRVYVGEIPVEAINKQFRLYNGKYKFATTQPLGSSKPISQILNF